ncbi:MAG: hypothetical protein KDI18_02585, partial [Gammaproteobacteria bacterium]|nr:hypothetical protein [Gammaproteobacteria bacterium]
SCWKIYATEYTLEEPLIDSWSVSMSPKSLTAAVQILRIVWLFPAICALHLVNFIHIAARPE